MREHTSLPANLVREEHCGWQLQARKFSPFPGLTAGWVCYVTGPTSSHELNIGRWGSCDEAIQHGRLYVDQRLSNPTRGTVVRQAALTHLVQLATD